MKTQDHKTQDAREEVLVTCPGCGTSGFTERGLSAHRCKGINRQASDPYVPTPRTSVLLEARKSLEKNRAILTAQITEFERQTLPYKLCLGLHCLKAYMVFVIPEPGARNASGKNQHSQRGHVTRDTASPPEGFEGWAEREIPWLKRPVAYKYMNALKGLGLDHQADEEAVFEAIRQNLRIGPCTLKMLCDAAAELVRPQLPAPKPEHQLEFDFLKENLHEFAVQSGNILAIADRLKTIPAMHKAACARVYGMLRDLTGTDWQPSDTPDSLCEIDPDTIDL